MPQRIEATIGTAQTCCVGVYKLPSKGTHHRASNAHTSVDQLLLYPFLPSLCCWAGFEVVKHGNPHDDVPHQCCVCVCVQHRSIGSLYIMHKQVVFNHTPITPQKMSQNSRSKPCAPSSDTSCATPPTSSKPHNRIQSLFLSKAPIQKGTKRL